MRQYVGFYIQNFGNAPLNETRFEKYLSDIQQVLTRRETIILILVFVGSKGLRVCVYVCVCAVWFIRRPGLPPAVPTASRWLYQPRTSITEGDRGRERRGDLGRGGEGRECKDSGKVNIIFNLRILLDFLLQSRSFFLLCFLCKRSCALTCYIYIRPFVTMPASSRPMIYLRGRRGKRLDNIYVA